MTHVISGNTGYEIKMMQKRITWKIDICQACGKYIQWHFMVGKRIPVCF